jgi:hypothetical protein
MASTDEHQRVEFGSVSPQEHLRRLARTLLDGFCLPKNRDHHIGKDVTTSSMSAADATVVDDTSVFSDPLQLSPASTPCPSPCRTVASALTPYTDFGSVEPIEKRVNQTLDTVEGAESEGVEVSDETGIVPAESDSAPLDAPTPNTSVPQVVARQRPRAVYGILLAASLVAMAWQSWSSFNVLENSSLLNVFDNPVALSNRFTTEIVDVVRSSNNLEFSIQRTWHDLVTSRAVCEAKSFIVPAKPQIVEKIPLVLPLPFLMPVARSNDIASWLE